MTTQVEYQLTDQDIEFLNYRTLLIKFIGEKNIVDKIKEIINESKGFSFQNERSSKFISFKNLEFTLKYDNEYLKNTYKKEFLKVVDVDSETTWISECIFNEVFIKMGDYIVSNIGQFKFESNVIKEETIKSEKFVKDLKSFSVIYTLLIDPKNSSVFVRYILF